MKQGGVISPVLFCIYIDGLLIELENSGVGCYMESVFAGIFGYADDVKLLTPTTRAMSKMVIISEQYAARYDVMFKAKKSQVIIYSCSAKKPPNPNITVYGKNVDVVQCVIHLGHPYMSKYRGLSCIPDYNVLNPL